MKKITIRPLIVSMVSVALCISGLAFNRSYTKVDAIALPHAGDTYGAARISFKALTDEEQTATIHFDLNGEGGAGFAGTGLFLRVANYLDTNTYVNMKLRSSNGALRGPKRGVQHTYLNAEGTEVTYDNIVLKETKNYLIIPASFDGYIYLDYNTQMDKTDDSNTKTFKYGAITAYFEVTGSTADRVDFALGDMFTDQTNIFDGSEMDIENFAKTFKEEGSELLNINQLPRTDEYEPRGDLLGSIKVKTPVSGGGFRVLADGKSIADGGVYVRIKNNSSEANYIKTHFNSRNNGRVTNKAGESYYLFDNEGLNKETYQFSAGEDPRLTIPANFDGFLHLPVTSYAANTVYSSEEFNVDDIYAVYFEGTIDNMDFGDMFTKSVIIYDGSEYYPADLNSHVAVDWDCTITLNEGHLIPIIPEFDYSEVEYVGDLEQAAHVTCVRDNEHNTIALLDIVLPQTFDFSDALAITVRMKGVSGDFPYFFRIIDENGDISELPNNNSEDKAKYVTLEGTVTNASSGGNNRSIKYPTGFDGNLVVPISTLTNNTASPADLSKVKAFRIGVAVYYDYDFNAVFGDIGYVIEDTKTNVIALDVSEANFEATYVPDELTKAYIKVKKYYPPMACSWIGDTKILNPLSYQTDEKLKEEVVWNDGDNACSYSVMDDGVFVHIGPFETGHTYGSYMCLQIDEKGVYTDRKLWSREVEGEKQLAKGITAYVKNLSRKEIGITLQIDEVTDENTLERWCITGYPAMYYAWDVNTNAEYVFYCKSDQFQIPVGFEGYVRIPFESYRVPDWCQSTKGVDNILNIERWSGKFYLTSDNTRFEDLEYFIKNIGVYFNDTRCGNLFDNTNTIKTNMGLQEGERL